MPRLTVQRRQHILDLWDQGVSTTDIVRKLQDEEGLKVDRETVRNTVSRWNNHKTVFDLPRRKVKGKLAEEHLTFIDNIINENREITSVGIKRELERRFGLSVHISTIKRVRKNKLNWVCSKPRYCQLIRNKNRETRLEYARGCLERKDLFENAIFTDESSIEIENTARLQFRRHDELPTLVGKPKHPLKVHVWAGISSKGATDIVIFEGIMNSDFYTTLLETSLLPFARKVFPDGDYRFIQDNDPKHTSKRTKEFMQDKGIPWWPTPAESPDLNPIEMVWHELKHYLRTEAKPHNQEQLKQGIVTFWRTRMTPEKCQRWLHPQFCLL